MSRVILFVGESMRRCHMTCPDLMFMNRYVSCLSVPLSRGGGRSLLTLMLVALLTGWLTVMWSGNNLRPAQTR